MADAPERAQTIRRPVTITELKTAVEFSPSECRHGSFRIDRVAHDEGKPSWRVMQFVLYADNHGQRLITATAPEFEIITQRGQAKRYKTRDAVFSDLEAILGPNSSLRLDYET